MSDDKKALKKGNQTAMATYDYGDDAGAGAENRTSEDVQLSFLSLLQSNSPACTEGGEEFVEGAKPGLFMDSVSKEVLGKELLFVPSTFIRKVMHWVPRDSGGGLIAQFETNDHFVLEEYKKAGARTGSTIQITDEKGRVTELVPTVYLFGLVVLDDGARIQEFAISFFNTKLKTWRNWNSSLTRNLKKGQQEPPFFANRVRLSSKLTPGKKGPYHSVVMGPWEGSIGQSLMAPDDPLYILGKKLYDMTEAGQVSTVPEQQETQTVDNDGDGVL